MKYYIIAGEASGDLHGSNLIKGLKEADPQAQFRFWGGDLMEQAADTKPVKHYKESSIMGYLEVLMNLRKIVGFLRDCQRDVKAWQPDVLILIDYPGFNFKMAKFAKANGIKTFYYIAPKVWAWKEGRVKLIQKYVDELFVIFPFEVDYFRKFSIEAHYFGNPLMDSVSERGEVEKDNIVALVAGSRKHEIDHNLPTMVEISRAFPDYRFVVTAVPWLDKAIYDKYLIGSNVEYICNETYSTIARSRAALVTSGTATLETALLGVPQVVCFRGPAVSMWIAARLVKLKWISLVNLVMNRTVVTELIQSDFTVGKGCDELRAILPGGSKIDKISADYKELYAKIGSAGASQRVAKEMYGQLAKR
ncbi:Lipid-A-disaccharide synthase [Mucinivorans hirudinis]|uniref:Lipid-A-disaccharide synthase n=1 Tax=Mucinivorans hirudinis TaxID=1433126 RepID=A0A060R9K6_9BACT|nr:Lipid-A-disaccharide synthase [Mucinivorans hirudinis]